MIATSEDIARLYPTVSSGVLESGALEPHIETAEMSRLIPLVGEALYDEVLRQKELPEATTKWLNLARYCRDVAVHTAMISIIPKLNANITMGGLSVTEGDNAIVASDARVERLVKNAQAEADEATERLLRYLEANCAVFADADGKELWHESEWYGAFAGLLINTIDDIEAGGVDIGGSRLRLKALLPDIRRGTTLFISAATGAKCLKQIIAEVHAEKASAEVADVYEKLRMALALWLKANCKGFDFVGEMYRMRTQGDAELLLRTACTQMKGKAEFPDYIGNAEVPGSGPFKNSHDNPAFVLG